MGNDPTITMELYCVTISFWLNIVAIIANLKIHHHSIFGYICSSVLIAICAILGTTGVIAIIGHHQR